MQVKIRIEITEDVYRLLLEGKKVPGQMIPDFEGCVIRFGAFGKDGKRRKKVHLAHTFFGEVYETATKIKLCESFPKKLGPSKMLEALDKDMRVAAEAIVDRDIINNA